MSRYKQYLKKTCHTPRIYTFTSKTPYQTVTLISGTHGDEPAGAIYLKHLIKKYNKGFPLNITLHIIPEVNKCGLMLNTRRVPDTDLDNWDLNRHYPIRDETPPDMIKKYLYLIEQSDLVVDIHEGWGYHLVNSQSKGSGIYPNGFGESVSIAKKMIKNVNKIVHNRYHRFVIANIEKIPGSLRYYCTRREIPYILVETSGKYDIAPLENRLRKLDKIIKTLQHKFMGKHKHKI